MWTRLAVLACISWTWLATEAPAAQLSLVRQASRSIVLLTGDITPDDPRQMRDFLARGDAAPVTALLLNSPGGNLVASVALAQLVRASGLTTIVAAHATCASACFLVFAAGHPKYVDMSSFVGVHGVADKDGTETAEARAATLAFARIIDGLGAPASVVSKLVTTPPHDIVWLTATELRGMGAIMTGRRNRARPDTAVLPIY